GQDEQESSSAERSDSLAGDVERSEGAGFSGADFDEVAIRYLEACRLDGSFRSRSIASIRRESGCGRPAGRPVKPNQKPSMREVYRFPAKSAKLPRSCRNSRWQGISHRG